ncbi:unnamed protein product, partial [Mycena citricolor]
LDSRFRHLGPRLLDRLCGIGRVDQRLRSLPSLHPRLLLLCSLSKCNCILVILALCPRGPRILLVFGAIASSSVVMGSGRTFLLSCIEVSFETDLDWITTYCIAFSGTLP